MDKGKGQVYHARFIGAVFLGGSVGPGGHLRLGEAADAPHLPDAESYLHQLGVDMGRIHGRVLHDDRICERKVPAK